MVVSRIRKRGFGVPILLFLLSIVRSSSSSSHPTSLQLRRTLATDDEDRESDPYQTEVNELPIEESFRSFTERTDASNDISEDMMGFQLGSDLNVDDFAGGMHFDASENAFYLTGSTMGKSFGTSTAEKSASVDCFLVKYSLTDDAILWRKQYTAQATKVSGCRSVLPTVGEDGTRNILAVGHVEKSNSLIESNSDGVILEVNGIDVNTVNGFLLGFRDDGESKDSDGLSVVGEMLDEYKVQYPMAITSLPGKNGFILASLSTDDDDINIDFELAEEMETEGRGYDPYGGVFKYGSVYKITLERFFMQGDKKEFRDRWTRIFGTRDREDARVADLVYVRGMVVFVGTTSGHGAVFGGSELITGKDLDGFVTKLNADTGNLVNSGKGATSDGGVGSLRIESQPQKNEILSGVCISKNSQEADYIYVVGSTTSIMDPTFHDYYSFAENDKFNAILIKLDIDTLNIVWTRQIGTYGGDIPADVLGMSCAVTDDEQMVYLSGLVTSSGSVIAHPHEDEMQGNGGDDIFVAAYNTKEGNQVWLKQVGTKENDILVKGNGGIAVYGKDSHVMVMGTTRGKFMGDKNGGTTADNDADVFIMSFNRFDGSHRATVENAIEQGVFTIIATQPNGDSQKRLPTSSRFFITSLFCVVFFGIFFAAYRHGVKRTQAKYINHHMEGENQLGGDQSIAQSNLEEDPSKIDYDDEYGLYGSGGVEHQFRKYSYSNDKSAASTAPETVTVDFVAGNTKNNDDLLKGFPEGIPGEDNISPISASSRKANAYDDLLDSFHSIQALRDSCTPPQREQKEFTDLKDEKVDATADVNDVINDAAPTMDNNTNGGYNSGDDEEMEGTSDAYDDKDGNFSIAESGSGDSIDITDRQMT